MKALQCLIILDISTTPLTLNKQQTYDNKIIYTTIALTPVHTRSHLLIVR